MNPSLKDRMTEQAAFNKKRLASQSDFPKTPKVKAILNTIDYLVHEYDLEVYVDSALYGNYVYLTVKKLTGLKDEKLAKMLESLVYSNPDLTRTYDNPASFSRTFTFTWSTVNSVTGFSANLEVAVTANFEEDSETCKRVVVGYKQPSTEPTPIYELQCSDADVEPDNEPNGEPAAYISPSTEGY